MLLHSASLQHPFGGASGSATLSKRSAGLVYCPFRTTNVSQFTSKKILFLPASSATQLMTG